MASYWQSPAPDVCDVCQKPIEDVFSDMKTVLGPWGCLCPRCVPLVGAGYGIGRGQQYTKQPDGKWLKTQG